MKTSSIKKTLTAPPGAQLAQGSASLLSSGSLLLDLACSGRSKGAFRPGHYAMFVGDSQAGKSWLSLQLLAEAAKAKAFRDYRLIHDNPERGTLMDIAKYFGPKLAARLEAPSASGPSQTVEGFYDHLDAAFHASIPFVYVLDSDDALPAGADVEKAGADRKARAKGKEMSGSYGMAKAKLHSAMLRQAHNELAKLGSILVVLKQTRDNIGFDAMFNPKTRSGGRALTFFATMELWFSVKGKLKRTVREKPRTIGSILQIKVKKNREVGRERAVELPFHPGVGFDETGSLVDYLVAEKRWPAAKGRIEAKGLGLAGDREAVIRKIEEQGKEPELRELVVETWNDIERQCEVERKPRYG